MAALDPKRWHYFGVAALAAFMATLDSSIVNLANPTLSSHFQVDVRVVAWVQQSYLLVTMAFLLIGGRLLDLLGERRLFVWGYSLFTAGSALCALSLSIYMLILSRAFQGLGASILMSANQGLVARSFPVHQRGRTLGMIGTVVSVGLASGPPLGGFLIAALGWRSIFYINVPIGIAAVFYCLRHLSSRIQQGKREGFDWTGAALIVVGLGALFIGMNFGAERGVDDAAGLALVAASLGVLWLFLLNEKKSPNPLLHLSLFRNRFFTQSCAASYLAFFAMISTVFLMPFYLQEVLQFEPAGVGLVMMTLPLAMLLVAPLGGWISDRIGSRIPATSGLALVGSGLWLLHGIEVDSPPRDVVLRLALIGIGMGFFGSPNSNAILSGVPRRHVGTASGLSALMRTSGIAFGIAFSAAAFTLFRNRAAAEFADQERVLYLEGIRPVFLLAAAIVALNMINSITRGRRPEVE
jgi:EmrB/QacA subfamily drug resistance transporter